MPKLGKLIVAADERRDRRHRDVSPPRPGRTASTISNGSRRARRSGSNRRCDCVAALLSPSTGIIDSHALMLAYQGEAEAAGAMVVLRTPVLVRPGSRRRFRARHRWRRADRDPLPLSRQRSWALRARPRARDRRDPARNDPAGLFLPRRLFHTGRASAVSAARLSGPGAGRTRRPHHSRSRGAGALRPGCRMDRCGRLHG